VAVVPPTLVETLGAATAPGNHEAEQFAVTRFLDDNAHGTYSGFAGVLSRFGRLQIYWKGALPPELRASAAQLGGKLPVDVYLVRFSAAEKTATQQALSRQAFANGACVVDAPYGVDAIELTTDRDPSLLNIPIRGPRGIPMILKRAACIRPK
jgi:hypothetical protein